jgi:hypothetical protein
MVAAAFRTALPLAALTLALTLSACSRSLPLLPESAPLPPLPQASPAPTPPAETPPAPAVEGIAPEPAIGPDWPNRERLALDIDLGTEDWKHFWGWPNVAGCRWASRLHLANTSADRDIRRWYQTRIRAVPRQPGGDRERRRTGVGRGADRHGAAAVLGLVEGGSPTDGGLWEWSSRRCGRCGLPPVIALYFLLGPERPNGDSRWQPFNDWHGVSGHTFIGAIPFLTAAAMTDDPLVKAPLVLGSFLTGWSRIHKDEHYFSQVALGWWMAYLAVLAVDQTQDGRNALTVTPTVTPEGRGVRAVSVLRTWPQSEAFKSASGSTPTSVDAVSDSHPFRSAPSTAAVSARSQPGATSTSPRGCRRLPRNAFHGNAARRRLAVADGHHERVRPNLLGQLN